MIGTSDSESGLREKYADSSLFQELTPIHLSSAHQKRRRSSHHTTPILLLGADEVIP